MALEGARPRRRPTLAVLLGFVLGFSGAEATASLLGDTVQYDRFFMEIAQTSEALLVDDTLVELVDDGELEVDLAGDRITLSVAPPLATLGFPATARLEFTDLDWSEPGGIASIQVDAPDVLNFDASMVSFSPDSVTIELDGVTLLDTGFLEITLPEPRGLAGWVVATCAAIAWRRRRRRPGSHLPN